MTPEQYCDEVARLLVQKDHGLLTTQQVRRALGELDDRRETEWVTDGHQHTRHLWGHLVQGGE